MLRPYRIDDIDRIVEIENNTLNHSLGIDFYTNDLNNPFAKHYVYEIDEKIVGFISSYFDGEIIEILNFCVDNIFQSQGYGSKMLSAFFNQFEANSSILEVRVSNERAIHVYEKFGFKTIRIRKQYYSNGEDALFMQKVFD